MCFVFFNVEDGRFFSFSSDPEGIAAPVARALSPYSIYVSWSVPSVPNGIVVRFIVQVTHQEMSRSITVNGNVTLEINVTSLDPYILYTVLVSACTIGGCGNSSSVRVRTLPAKPEKQPSPTAEALTSTSLRVTWDPPERPNGVIQGYVLYRRTLEDLVSRNLSYPTEYVQVFDGSRALGGALQRGYEDRGLGIYSLHQYKVRMRNINTFLVSVCIAHFFLRLCLKVGVQTHASI